jgi:competence protein ComGC
VEKGLNKVPGKHIRTPPSSIVMKTKSNKGLTLFELALFVALISIISVMLILNLKSRINERAAETNKTNAITVTPTSGK